MAAAGDDPCRCSMHCCTCAGRGSWRHIGDASKAGAQGGCCGGSEQYLSRWGQLAAARLVAAGSSSLAGPPAAGMLNTQRVAHAWLEVRQQQHALRHGQTEGGAWLQGKESHWHIISGSCS